MVEGKQTAESNSLWEDWCDFTQDSSMHGVRYVYSRGNSVPRRIVWLLLMLGSLCYFSYAAYLFMDVYVNKGVKTKISVQTADQLEFPSITVCNKNMWKISSLHKAAIESGSDGVYEVMEWLYSDEVKLPPDEEYFDWKADKFDVFRNLTAKELSNFFKDAAHPLSELVSDCKLHGKEVDCTDIFVTVKTEAGYCVQFNSNGTQNASSAGKTSGLRFISYVNAAEYTTGPFSLSEGISLTFHEAHEYPLVPELSTGVPPGIEIDFRLQTTATSRKPPPAEGSNCFPADEAANPLHFFSNYSFSACQTECKISYVLDKCGCRDPFHEALNGSRQCSIEEMLYCSTPALRNFVSDPNGLSHCQCQDACKVSEYTAKIGTTKFPSSKYVNLYNLSRDAVDFIAANVIIVNIYYGKMSYQRIDEEYAYGITDMIANMGGTLGLCIGASILTICEFFEFVMFALKRCFNRRTKGKSLSGLSLKVAPTYS